MTEIVIEIMGKVAMTMGDVWECDDKSVRDYLNLISKPENIVGYFTSESFGLLAQVEKQEPNIKIISITNTSKHDPSLVY